MPKVLNVISGVLVLLILLMRWLPEAIGERRAADEHNAQLSRMATVDAMTGLFNRGHFLIQAESEFERAGRYHRPLSLLMLDIDHFKSINDRFGHDVGDRVIVEIASILRYMAREADLAARLGGEEFVMMLPETCIQDAASLGERLRAAIAATPIQATGGLLSLTVSIGVGGSDGSATVCEMLKQADLALYRAKDEGRNRICLCSENATMPPAQTGVSGL
jgi:diguanylate cyclase (GGDEF)-like protein